MPQPIVVSRVEAYASARINLICIRNHAFPTGRAVWLEGRKLIVVEHPPKWPTMVTLEDETGRQVGMVNIDQLELEPPQKPQDQIQ